MLLDEIFSFSKSSTLHIYQVGGNAEREQGNQPSTEWSYKKVNSFLWGLVRQDVAIANCTLGDGTRTGIEELRIESTFPQRMATLFTLGFWSPMTISWRGTKQIGPRGEL